jgi:glutamine cyclotransferase
VRPSHAILVLFILMSGCSAGTDAPASASSSAPAALPASPSVPASVPASAEPDWSALPALDDAVTATAPLAQIAGRYTSATADGVWTPGNGGAGAAVARLDPETLEVVSVIELGGQADSWAEASAPSANGIWVTLTFQHAVALVDPQTNSESRRIGVEADPYNLVEDGDSLWVVDFGASTVVRIDIATGEERLRVQAVGPTEVVVGFGSVWVVEHSGNIVRLDPATGDALATIPVGGRPGIAIGFGSVWARSDDEATVSRIDPATNRVVATIPMPTNTGDIEVAGDSVWVVGGPQRGSCERNSYLVRIDPASNDADGFMPMSCPTSLVTDGTRLWAGSTKDGETAYSILSLDPGQRP